MRRDELLDIADYIIKQTALMASELLYEKIQGENKWISQSEAWRRYGRTTVNKMLIAGKLHTRRNGNRIEYYLKDLIENSNTKKLIFNK